MYNVFDKFVLRTPMLSYSIEKFDEFIDINRFFDNPVIQESIFIASRDMYDSLIAAKRSGLDLSSHKHLQIALTKYLSRMSTRCTPFGLFAKCSVGKFEDEDKIIFDNVLKRHTRFDKSIIDLIISQLIGLSEIRETMKFYPNTSLFLCGDKYRYYEIKKNTYVISEVNYSTILKDILKKSYKGFFYQDIVLEIVNKGYSFEESKDYLNELIDSQILISEMESFASSEEVLLLILDIIKNTAIPQRYYNFIINSMGLFKKLDTNFVNKIDIYEKLSNMLIEHGINKISNIVQVDCMENSQLIFLNKKYKKRIIDAISFLQKISCQNPQTNLSNFISKFYEKYGDMEVPLLESLDPIIGLGYPEKKYKEESILLKGLYLPTNNDKSAYYTKPLDRLLINKLEEMYMNNSREILLTDEDVLNISQTVKYPETFSCMAEIGNNGSDHIIYIKAVGGSSAINWISRFSSFDEDVENIIKSIVNIENQLNQDVILAEILYCPEGRVGNVLGKSKIRKHELPYLTYSSFPNENTILPSDLFLKIIKGKLVLYSKKLKKLVKPILSNAHNYSSSTMPFYRFLTDFQNYDQNVNLNFSWGYLENKLNYFPRIKYLDVILSLAKWKIDLEIIRSITNESYNYDCYLRKIKEWICQYKINRLVQYCQADNSLLIDWHSFKSVQAFLSVVKNEKEVYVNEFFFENVMSIISNNTGEFFTNEFIFFLYKDPQ